MSDASRAHSSQLLTEVLTVTASWAVTAWLDSSTQNIAGHFWQLLYVLKEGTLTGFSFSFFLFHMLLKLSGSHF